jgi:hypothetical protein
VYGFNYHNHASQQIPPGGFPFTAEVTDHFNLVGNGQANQFQVHFVARVTFLSPISFTIQFFKHTETRCRAIPSKRTVTAEAL